MKIPPYQKLRWFTCGCLIVIAAALLVLIAMIQRTDSAAISDYDNLQVKTTMLMGTLHYVGVSSPEDAAQVWAQGLKLRNAAMQYSVMTQTLKEQYAKQWEETAPGWVTGVSSPWISSYEVISEQTNNESYTALLQFETETSTGTADTYEAELTIVPEDNFWRISNITIDKGLYPYAGLKAAND
jgi:hypothetical protein